MIIPPDILKDILHRIEADIKSHTRLKLCEDPESNIWSYYGTIKLTPIGLEDCLMLILTVPLIDQSLQMNLYKIYNITNVTSRTARAHTIRIRKVHIL